MIIGGGIAGVECALMLKRTLPGHAVVIVSEAAHLRISPSLVYVPFGVPAQFVDVPLRELETYNIELVQGSVTSIDAAAKQLQLSGGECLNYDELVIATGVSAVRTSAFSLRNLRDAQAFSKVFEQLADGHSHQELMIRCLPDGQWDPPGIELALLADAELDRRGMRDLWQIAIASSDSLLLEGFGYHVSEAIHAELKARNITTIMGVPPARIENLQGTLTVDCGNLQAVHLPGAPALGPSGFYEVDHTGRAGAHIHVIGDATGHVFKGAFTSSWHALRLAQDLGGDLTRLENEIDKIPIGEMEYQMDLGDGRRLRVRMDARGPDGLMRMPIHTESAIERTPPDKLRGLMIRELIERTWQLSASTAHAMIKHLDV